MTTLIIAINEMKDIRKIVTVPEESRLLIKSVSKKFENDADKQRGGFLNNILGTLTATFLSFF